MCSFLERLFKKFVDHNRKINVATLTLFLESLRRLKGKVQAGLELTV